MTSFLLQMMRVRRMLTEVLLEVTNEEIDAIAQEVHHKERSRASKGSSPALRSRQGVANLLLLVGYFQWTKLYQWLASALLQKVGNAIKLWLLLINEKEINNIFMLVNMQC